MQQQIDWFSAFIIGALATAGGHLFDVPMSVLWVAFIGSVAGVAASETTALKAVALILIVTPATGWMLPFVMHFLPAPALKGLAFVISFILVAYWPLVRQQIPRLVVAVFDRATSIIRGPQP
jgi:hypothetical protein